MSLFTVPSVPSALLRGLLSLGCVLALTSALAGCALEAASEDEPTGDQNSAELTLGEVDEGELEVPVEQQEQAAPGGEIGEDSSDPTPDPWHSTDPTPDPWDEIDNGVGRNFVAPHQGR